MAKGRGGCQGIGFALKRACQVGDLGGERVARCAVAWCGQ